VTLWTVLGAVGCIVATFTAFPELRSGWWAAAVLANPAIIDALLFGQQSFAWGSMLLLFGVAAWRRGHHAWAAVLVGLGQANHAAIVLPIGVLLVVFALIVSRDRREILRWYALSLVITIPAVWLVLASPTTAQAGIGGQVVNFFGTLGPRSLIVALPIFCVLLQRTGIAALAPLGLVVALVAGAAFEVPLNVGQQWRALVHRGTDTAALDAYLRSPAFVPGATYRVLYGGDAKLTLYHVLRAGGRLDSELFPEDLATRNFRDVHDYVAFLCSRRIDRIVHDDTFDESHHTNEIGMILMLERAPTDGVALQRVATGPGLLVDSVDRSGCSPPS
jgi:hypothetical protein